MKKVLILALIVSLISCEDYTEDIPKDNNINSEYVTDTIRISDNQTTPIITVGFYGFALEWKGDFMPGTENIGTIDSLQTDIFIYHKLTFDSIMNARVDETSLFWYVDSINQIPIKIIQTNNKGFYEIELDSGSYTGIVKCDDQTLYNNSFFGDGQIGPMIINSDTLIKINFNIDFEKSE